jgi:hypothetical protein
MVQPTIQRAPRLWVALLGIAVLTAAAAFAGREFYRPRPEAATQTVTVTTGNSTPPSSTSKPAPPGSPEVRATPDGAEHPLYPQVRQMLQDYFDGINKKNYAQWRSSVTKARAQDMSESKFKSDFASTKDGSIVVYRIETAPQQTLRVLVSFTSVQNAADAPPELPKECIDWHFVLPVSKEDNKWRIDIGDGTSSPRHEECGTQTS